MVDGSAIAAAPVSPKSPCAPRVPARYRLEFDDGTAITVRGRGLIGREPTAPADSGVEHLIHLVDDGLSVSRTHLEFGIGASRLWIQDCASTNGSHLEVDGQRHTLESAVPVAAPPGCLIHLGEWRIRVRATSGRAVVGSATVDWGVATHVGATRRQNEDSYCAAPPVFVVADGMGGHTAGDLANRAVVDSLLALSGDEQVTTEMLTACLADARARLDQIPASGRATASLSAPTGSHANSTTRASPASCAPRSIRWRPPINWSTARPRRAAATT